MQAVGLCASVSNPGDRVDISGEQHRPGASGPSDVNTPSRPPATDPDADADAEPDASDCEGIDCRGGYGIWTIPDLTVADIASFVPARPTLTNEPYGIGVVGAPANLVATAAEQRMPGTLFDLDVVVRFVPASFVFDYGDGTRRETSVGGASWSSLRQADFTPTPTSHVYRARGTYRAAVTVRYAASVDFGDGWRPVTGYVEATTGGHELRVFEVHTALVEKTCQENPRGPGC